ncbi:hypothetical protein AbraIFM66950_005261 [Aspergillus brasiliensis]|nr:hypothetical protein AbraIFM66950_005261 [Aspergillus brasiliensis]
MSTSLYLSSEWSDLTIRCGDQVFPAHKWILCQQSEYFARACNGSFIESSGEIVIEELEPIYFRETLKFLYTGDYTAQNNAETSPVVPAVGLDHPIPMSEPTVVGYSIFHAHMYQQGDYFLIHNLKEKAKWYFEHSIFFDLHKLLFPAVVNKVYSSTIESDCGLRDVVIKTVIEHLPTSTGSVTYFDKEDLRETPEFAIDLCMASLNHNVDLELMNADSSEESRPLAGLEYEFAGWME